MPESIDELRALVERVLKQNAVLLEEISKLREENALLREENQQLRDEVARLKGLKGKPDIKPSGMEKGTDGNKKAEGTGKRAGSEKRVKTAALKIHEEVVIQPAGEIPAEARFKGYRDFIVQDLHISAHNIKYRLAEYRLPNGTTLMGALPPALDGQHFGPELRAFILYQHHQCRVTQPLLREMLIEFGIDISTGQVDALLTHGQEAFAIEKDALLTTGLKLGVVTVDDTGARHQGQNGYTTHIGNALFAWFGTTNSKSRINFLELLQAKNARYRISEDSVAYFQTQTLPTSIIDKLLKPAISPPLVFCQAVDAWQWRLDQLGIMDERHRRTATEGALIGGLSESGLDQLAIVSDGAGQFNVLQHGMCWVHAERLVYKLLPQNDLQRKGVETVRASIWSLYADLKAYKASPAPESAKLLADRFDEVFKQRTGYASLDRLLKRLHSHKAELLLVLKRPDVPLHTNGSESDIREYVTRRKVSGGTRSDLGRQCRDTFTSLKKTCRKLDVSFWEYLRDRIFGTATIKSLADILKSKAALH